MPIEEDKQWSKALVPIALEPLILIIDLQVLQRTDVVVGEDLHEHVTVLSRGLSATDE